MPGEIVVKQGGTGAQDAAGARNNLGLGKYPDIQESYLLRFCTGLLWGGAITLNGADPTKKIDIAAGGGEIIDHVARTIESAEWLIPYTGIPMAGPGDNYISIHDGGSITLAVGLVKPPLATDIYLGHVFVDSAGDIMEFFSVPDLIGHYTARVNEAFADFIGSGVADGNSVVEKPGHPLELDIDGGEIYVRLLPIDLLPTSTFKSIYTSSDLGWGVDGTTPNHVDTLYWNNPALIRANALVAMTPTFWKKDLIARMPNGNVYLIRAQAEHATEALAIAGAYPVIPAEIAKDSVYLAAIIVEQGAATLAPGLLQSGIVNITPNLRRVYGYGSGNAAVTLSHAALADRSVANSHPPAAVGAEPADADIQAHIGGTGAPHTAAGVGADPAGTAAGLVANYVPITRTVNGRALNGNITLTNSDVGAAATAHTHAPGDVTGTAVVTGDGRLVDARRPLDYQTAIGLARSTFNTNTNFQNKTALTTPALTGTYELSWTAILDGSATNQNVESQLYNTTDAVILGVVQIMRPSNSAERRVVSGFGEVVFTGAAKTFNLQYRTSNTGSTVGIADARIKIVKVAP